MISRCVGDATDQLDRKVDLEAVPRSLVSIPINVADCILIVTHTAHTWLRLKHSFPGAVQDAADGSMRELNFRKLCRDKSLIGHLLFSELYSEKKVHTVLKPSVRHN